MVRYLLVGILVTGSIVGFQLYKVDATPGAMQSHDTELGVNKVNSPSTPQVNSIPATVHQDEDLGDTRNSELTSSNLPQAQQQDRQEIWQSDDSLPTTPNRYTNNGIDAQPLTINKQEIANMGVGDTVSIPLPQTSKSYEMDVREVGRHANGDKSLKGHLVDNPDYTVVMTEGTSSTFATINTPEGSFLLEANGTQGWVMSQTDLDYMADPKLIDYQIPDIAR